MKLAALIQDLDHARVIGNTDVDVGAIHEDSRQVQPGDVFVAVRGRSTDGHRFLDKAVAMGAVAVVVEQGSAPRDLPAHVTQVLVPHTAEALGTLVAARAGRPAERLTLVGITGTNGKTTTTYLVESILRAAGAIPGVIGTVSYRYRDTIEPAPYTTPTPLLLHGVLGRMVAAGCTHGIMEVSSVALDMNRLAAIDFGVAAFTNLTQDHLDLHGTMEAYGQAKELLFRRHLAAGGAAVVNLEDPAAGAMLAAAEAGAADGRAAPRLLRVSARINAPANVDVRVLRADSSIHGIRAVLTTPRGLLEVCSHALLGQYNIANLTMAVAIGEALGLDQAAIARGIADMPGVPGRVERVANDAGLDILVDYAHTPDALANVLAALRPLTRRRLICVFGCGGDRDPGKRPQMGAVVAAQADLAVVTSDNPRTEDPQSIVDMILPAVPRPFFVHTDRRTAIAAAVCEATPGDIVLIAGKGHEDYQILGSEKIHFDDREEAARAARARWRFPADELARVAGGTIAHRPAGIAAVFSRVHFDGRAAAPGDLYVAIRGTSHDGHDFCAQAVAAGATGVMVETGRMPRGQDGAPLPALVIEVADTRAALGAMAHWHRQRWGALSAAGPEPSPETAADLPAPADPRAPAARPVIGITGSAGKTTTKELCAAALSARRCVHATRGSLNNETGVPLTLLGLQPYHDAAVIEMGMRGLGQIDYLARMAAPTVAAVINAGTAHVGVVGSIEAIARGKAEIFAHLPGEGVAVHPAGDERLHAYAIAAPAHMTFGDATSGADVRLVGYQPAADGNGAIVAEVCFAVNGHEHRGRLAMVGRHNALDAACALACAVAAGVPAAEAVAAMGRAQPAAMRGEVIDIAGRRVLVDCYNANPGSMAAALATLAELRDHAKAGAAAPGSPGNPGSPCQALAVLGDMLELGDGADRAHEQAGSQAAAQNIRVIALGQHAQALAAGAGALGSTAATPESAAEQALAHTRPGDWILIKASRGLRLERVVEAAQRLSRTMPSSTPPSPSTGRGNPSGEEP